MTLCWREVTLHLENMSLIASTICMNGELGSHECSHSAVHGSHKPTTNTPEHGGGFEISFTECAKEMSLITLPHIDVETENQKSLHSALNGQLLWLGMHCLPQLLALLSLSMGQTPQATVDTIYEVSKVAWKATVWAKMPLEVHARHSLVVVTYTHAGWTTPPDTSQGEKLVFIANAELLQGKESNMSLISWNPSRLRRVARPSSAAETQAAADGDDEAVHIR